MGGSKVETTPKRHTLRWSEAGEAYLPGHHFIHMLWYGLDAGLKKVAIG